MNKFLEKFKTTESIDNTIENVNSYIDKSGFSFIKEIINDFGGITFNNGVFRIHTYEYVEKWTVLLKNYFMEELPEFDLICFASNWQGNMYCINSLNSEIVYFDPATCEFFEAEFSIEEFFDSVLVDEDYDIIFEEYFDEVRNHINFDTIAYNESIGHKIYLHLGGKDEVQNLEIVNTEALWDLQINIADRINEIPK